MDDNGTCAYLHIITEGNIPEYRGPSTDYDSVAKRRVPLSALGARAAQRDALVKQYIVSNFSCFADDHAHAMIDK